MNSFSHILACALAGKGVPKIMGKRRKRTIIRDNNWLMDLNIMAKYRWEILSYIFDEDRNAEPFPGMIGRICEFSNLRC